jgi:3-isopropylmalate/(R)-2-methylmalate dehydratase large subunit
MSKTLFDKIWDAHLVKQVDDETQVLAIDRHFIHEVTSPQAFESLRDKGVKVLRSDLTTATADHNVPTVNQHLPIENELSRKQLDTLTSNCWEHNIELFQLGNENNGIVHVVGPELGITQPGMTIVCGDSHTSTHGAFGTISFGIGTSQVAQVLASQCVLVAKPKTMLIKIEGNLKNHISSKDVILHVIKSLGTDIGTGCFIEYAGSTIQNMSMEGRMTICNMSIEMGARGGLIAPDKTTFDYLKNKKYAKNLKEDDWNTAISSEIQSEMDDSFQKALEYMGLADRKSMLNLEINHVFIGSCTNGRYEDFELVASYVKGKKKAPNVKAMLVPGSNRVLAQIKKNGLDKVFEEAGFELRQPGCSACLAMNGDTIPAGEYCVSTSNRNFEGRQGAGARTILASPVIAALAAIEGKIVDPNNR